MTQTDVWLIYGGTAIALIGLVLSAWWAHSADPVDHDRDTAEDEGE